MDLWSTLALLAKRWYIAGLILLLTVGASLATVARIAPVFEVNSPLVLLLPPSESPDGNPYTSGFQNQVLAQLVVQNLSATATVTRLVAQGADPQYSVVADNSYAAAFVHVISRSRELPVALRTTAVVSAAVEAEAERLQADAGAPAATWVRTVPLAASPEPHLLKGSRIRPLAGLLLASLMATFGVTLGFEALSRRRARRRASGPILEAQAPWRSLVSDTGGELPSLRVDQPLSARPEPRRHPFDAVDAVTVFLVLLVGIPARLVFSPLGAAGTPANMWGLVLLIWWIAHRLIPGRATRTFQPVRLAIQFLGLAALLSYSAAFFRPIDIVEIFAADRGLIALAAWSGVALVVADGIVTRARLRRLVERVVSAGSVLAGIGVMQFFTSIDIRPWYHIPFLTVNGDFVLVELNSRSGFNRVSGTANHPIEFSAVLAMILPLALYLAFHADPSRRRRAWLRVALIGMAVPLSVSRTGMLGLIVGGLVLFVSWPAKRRWRAIAMLPVLAVGSKLLVPGLLGSIQSLFLHIQSDNSFTGRTQDYAAVARFFSRTPIIGRGWGTLLPDRYILLDNQFLKTLVEAGLVGALALLALFIIGIGTARGAYHRAPDAEGRDLGQTFAASLAIGLISFVTFDAFAFAMVPAMVFLVVGAAGALWRLSVLQPEDEPLTIPTKAASTVSPASSHPRPRTLADAFDRTSAAVPSTTAPMAPASETGSAFAHRIHSFSTTPRLWGASFTTGMQPEASNSSGTRDRLLIDRTRPA